MSRRFPVWTTILQSIALFTATPRWPFARQTPGGLLCWDGCRFTVNPGGGRFDGCVVYDGMLSDVSIECPPDRLFLITGEPPAIKAYNEAFAAQFSAVVTCHTDLPHRRLILAQQSYPWFVGVDKNAVDLGAGAKDLDAFLGESPPAKSRLLSVMVSDKGITSAHRHRRKFVGILRAHFGDQLEIFGRGVRDIGDKAHALLPFKYHLALENCAFFHYWTEKLADPFLSWSFPFYWGSPNAEEYFPDGSFERVNIYDPQQTIKIIERAIGEDTYAKALPAIAEARRRILQDYNLFAVVAKLCSPVSAMPPQTVRLRPEQVFRDHWTRKLRHRVKRALPRRLRKKKTPPLGAPLD
jgi:hypothetical protein